MISEEVTMLLARMDTHPDEFVNIEWNPVSHGAWHFEPFEDVRWGNVIKAVVQTGKEYLFTPEESTALSEKYQDILRKKCRETILKELINGEKEKEIDFRAKQLDLPYTTAFTGTAIQKARQKTEILEALKRHEAYEAHKNKGMLG